MRNAKMALGAALTLCAGQAAGSDTGLDWLAGQWCGGGDERKIEEAWLAEAGGMLVGVSRTMHGAQLESFEFMRIVVDGGTSSLHVQPNGAAPTVFAQVERGEGRVRFGNAAHDFPNLIEYRREGDALHAWIAGPGQDGEQMRISFDYRRCGG